MCYSNSRRHELTPVFLALAENYQCAIDELRKIVSASSFYQVKASRKYCPSLIMFADDCRPLTVTSPLA